MRRLKITNYTVKVKVPDQRNLGQEIEIELPYHFKTSVLNLMFLPELKLSGAELVRQNMLAMKLEACTNEEIELADEEYQRIKKAVDTFAGFTRQDVELVERINNAETT